MGTEFETQVLDIDVTAIVNKLRQLKAKETPQILQKRWVFDIDCLNSQSPGTGEWVRLRQVGNKSTITYKNKRGVGISETEEIEVGVDNFEDAAAILNKLKCWTGAYYQENKRQKFELDNITFTIDTWPLIPSFLEVEGQSEQDVHRGLQMLGLSGKDVGHIGCISIYEKYGLKMHSYKEIKFGMKK